MKPPPEDRGADQTQGFSVPDLQSRAMSIPGTSAPPPEAVRIDVSEVGEEEKPNRSAKPGEFTQFMNSLEPSRSHSPLVPRPRGDGPVMSTVPEFREERGGFTELLEPGTPRRTEVPANPRDNDLSFLRPGANPNDATRVFDAAPEPPPHVAGNNSPRVQPGPGEYTQAIERGRQPAPTPVAPAGTKSKEQARSKPPVVVIVGVVVTVILLTLLVLVIAQARS